MLFIRINTGLGSFDLNFQAADDFHAIQMQNIKMSGRNATRVAREPRGLPLSAVVGRFVWLGCGRGMAAGAAGTAGRRWRWVGRERERGGG
jgi:hypothetical protein